MKSNSIQRLQFLCTFLDDFWKNKIKIKIKMRHVSVLMACCCVRTQCYLAWRAGPGGGAPAGGCARCPPGRRPSRTRRGWAAAATRTWRCARRPRRARGAGRRPPDRAPATGAAAPNRAGRPPVDRNWYHLFVFCWTEKPVDNGRAIALRSAEKEVQYVKWKVPKNETNEMVHI